MSKEGVPHIEDKPQPQLLPGIITLKNGKKIDIVKAVPPDRNPAKHDTVLAGAWSMDTDVYAQALKTIAGRGRSITGINHPRWDANPKKIEPSGITPEDKLTLNKRPKTARRKAYTLLGVLDADHSQKASVIAHSEGYISAALAALADPRIRNITAIAPAGFFDEKPKWLLGKLLHLAKRAGKQTVEIEHQLPEDDPEGLQFEDKSTEAQQRKKQWLDAKKILLTDQTPQELAEAKAVAELGGYSARAFVLKNIRRTFHELADLVRADMSEVTKELLRRGVGITFILPTEDKVYPLDEIIKKVRETGAKVITIPGDHGQLGDRVDIAALAEAETTAMEEDESIRAVSANKA